MSTASGDATPIVVTNVTDAPPTPRPQVEVVAAYVGDNIIRRAPGRVGLLNTPPSSSSSSSSSLTLSPSSSRSASPSTSSSTASPSSSRVSGTVQGASTGVSPLGGRVFTRGGMKGNDPAATYRDIVEPGRVVAYRVVPIIDRVGDTKLVTATHTEYLVQEGARELAWTPVNEVEASKLAAFKAELSAKRICTLTLEGIVKFVQTKYKKLSLMIDEMAYRNMTTALMTTLTFARDDGLHMPWIPSDRDAGHWLVSLKGHNYDFAFATRWLPAIGVRVKVVLDAQPYTFAGKQGISLYVCNVVPSTVEENETASVLGVRRRVAVDSDDDGDDEEVVVHAPKRHAADAGVRLAHAPRDVTGASSSSLSSSSSSAAAAAVEAALIAAIYTAPDVVGDDEDTTDSEF